VADPLSPFLQEYEHNLSAFEIPFPRLMDNHSLPMENCFSSQIEVIGFAPTETINSIHNRGI
jgi:hypothetical protein